MTAKTRQHRAESLKHALITFLLFSYLLLEALQPLDQALPVHLPGGHSDLQKQTEP
jgi:hypothetical protein